MFWRFVGKVWKLMKLAAKYAMYALIGSTVTAAIVPWVDMILSLQEVRMMLGVLLSWLAFRIFKEDMDMRYDWEEAEEMQ